MKPCILGIGTALPVETLSCETATEIAVRLSCEDDRQARVLAGLYRRTGIATRQVIAGAGDFYPPPNSGTPQGPGTGERMRVYAGEAEKLAGQSALAALEESGVKPNEISHLVTVSCTGFAAPGVDIALIRGLGLPLGTERTHIGFMGCHGAINGLRVARALAALDPKNRVLVTAVELCSLHYQYGWEPNRITSNALFGDGAASVVVGTGTGPELLATGSTLVPDTADEMGWHIGDHGFEMHLSAAVPGIIGRELRPWVAGWLAGNGLSLSDIRGWAIHPGGPRIVEAARQSLGLERDAVAPSLEILKTCGNMSSPTVLFIAKKLMENGEALPLVLLAFGPGLMVEGILVV